MASQSTAADQGTARAARLSRLKAEADQHAVVGLHAKEATAHYERGEMHEETGNDKAAAAAYKAGMHAMGKHAEMFGCAGDCGYLKRGR
jgi:exoribonuclease R